jgi:SpoVK/Ycf46/Vps4 family AAA+-type ATPase
LIIGATNNPGLLDRALFRRFDDVLRYEAPDAEARRRLIENVLTGFKSPTLGWKNLLKVSDGLSHAEIDHACRDAIKDAILHDQPVVSATALLKALQEKLGTHPR